MGLSDRTLAAYIAIGLAAATPAVAEQGRLTVELNKLEDAEGGGCQAFFLFRNQSGLTLEAFEMSLAVLDSNGVIDRLLTVDAAPLPADRTTLKLFEIPDMVCASVTEVLLHEIAACRPQNAEEIDCFDIISLDSHSTAALVK